MTSWFKAGVVGGLALVFLTGFIGLSNTAGVRFDQTRSDLITAAEAAIDQISKALTSVLFSWSKIQVGDRMGAETHVHEAINIVEGEKGSDYDPKYGTAAEGVGDGVGALNHAQALLDKLRQIEQNSASSNYIVAAENAVDFLRAAIPHLLRALELLRSSDSLQEAIVLPIREAQALLMAARASQEEKDRPTEGGARTILAWLNDSTMSSTGGVQH